MHLYQQRALCLQPPVCSPVVDEDFTRCFNRLSRFNPDNIATHVKPCVWARAVVDEGPSPSSDLADPETVDDTVPKRHSAHVAPVLSLFCLCPVHVLAVVKRNNRVLWNRSSRENSIAVNLARCNREARVGVTDTVHVRVACLRTYTNLTRNSSTPMRIYFSQPVKRASCLPLTSKTMTSLFEPIPFAHASFFSTEEF